MPIIDKDYFIEFANYTTGIIERMYDEFPKELVSAPEDGPVLKAPIKTSIHSLMVDCRGPNMSHIPDRMIAFVKSFQQSLRNILNSIIENEGMVKESEGLNFIIDLQERTISKYKIEEGRLIEKSMLNPDDQYKVAITPGWLNDTCRTLIDFLCDGNLKQLKKCPFCNLFFIAKDNKRKRCYSKSCAKEYEKEKKRKQREDDPVKYV